MNKQKNSLLSGLMNSHSKAEGSGDTQSIAAFKVSIISIKNISSSPFNPYSVANVEELKASIELCGLQQNLVVRQLDEAGKYELISGHRRYKALSELVAEGKESFERVPCKIIKSIDDIDAELQLIFANSTARRLTDYEIAYQAGRIKELLTKLKDSGYKIEGRKRDIVAELLEVSASQVARLESINKNLSPELMEAFKDGEINVTTAYESSRLPAVKQEEVLAEHKRGQVLTPKKVNEKRVKEKPPRPPLPSIADIIQIDNSSHPPTNNPNQLTLDGDFVDTGGMEQTNEVVHSCPATSTCEYCDTCTHMGEVGPTLKPCPFCGHSASLNKEYDRISNSRWVTCDGCLVATPGYSGENAAVSAWNKRT